MPGTAADRLQQLGEQRPHPGRGVAALPGREHEVATVGVDVLAEERDLGDAVGGECLDLGDDVGERPADLAPRTAGTMQNAQELSQPIWMVTHAL